MDIQINVYTFLKTQCFRMEIFPLFSMFASDSNWWKGTLYIGTLTLHMGHFFNNFKNPWNSGEQKISSEVIIYVDD